MSCLLIIDHNRATHAVARAFHGLGFKVIAGVAGYCDYAFLSRFVSETVEIGDLVDHPEQALTDVIALSDVRPELTGILSVDETGTRWLAQNHDRLPAGLTAYAARPENVLNTFNKAETAQLAMALRVPVAPHIVVDTLDNLHAAAKDIGPPFVVRAVESNHDLYGVKVLVCHSMDAFERTATHWPTEGHRQLMVQRFNAGFRHNVCWNAINGVIHSAIEMKVLQTTTGTNSGYGTLVETVAPHPELKRYAARFAEALGYHGLGSPQFLVDPASGDISFLEINPRLDANIRLAQTVMPYIEHFAGIVEGRITKPLTHPWSYRRGRRLFWLKGENQTLKALFAKRAFGQLAARAAMMAPHSLSSVDPIFSWDDPLPALAGWLHPVLRHLPEKRFQAPSGLKTAREGPVIRRVRV
jgi:predicted ATP-grasp superfamily ATP-dependent carboligase